ncbi:acyl-coenzyme A thioesterase 1-like isoform X1 [Phascolarctos cinereus]|uniref:Acyl-coenzyme A thioesterase 1-like isoform X2 n=1 Tax=Phascolarctos cinereus TaxID=38626 RepID=A0A6P5KB42_PHACI|nr:acyl-coenzyme A thioesterase 1-like isoform X2 [Phascolarctos cinereus]
MALMRSPRCFARLSADWAKSPWPPTPRSRAPRAFPPLISNAEPPTVGSSLWAFSKQAASSSMAVSVRLTPGPRSLWDEPLAISVHGLAPAQRVTLRASLRDEKGELFQASARYEADAGGQLDLARAPALGGSYRGVEPMGLFWSMKPDKPYWRLVKRDVQTPFLVDLEVYEGHDPQPTKVLAQVVHERGFLGPGVKRIPVREGNVRATLFLPPGSGPFPGIIDMFGTGGGLFEYRASLLARRGFAVLALAYYAFEDLPKDMKELHLEYFEEAVQYLKNHSQVKGPGVGLLGFSKGGDLCLSMASHLKDITATVTLNGSLANVGCALHYKGMTIPPLGSDPKRIKMTKDGFADIVDALNNPLEEPNRTSLIPVQKAESCFLFLVGLDDHNWKSEFYANEAAKLLQAHGKKKPKIICYPATGHYIELPYFPVCLVSFHNLVGKPVIWGGEVRAHSMAQIDAWKQLQAFFHKHLGNDNKSPKL